MQRFAPALRRVARELDLPAGARALILRELAADLDDVYAHHRSCGVEAGEAQRRAEEAVLGTPALVRRLARLHRRSWRAWSESMGMRLRGGTDLLVLLFGAGPVLLFAALFSVRAVLQSGGLLAWLTGAGAVVITVVAGRCVVRLMRCT